MEYLVHTIPGHRPGGGELSHHGIDGVSAFHAALASIGISLKEICANDTKTSPSVNQENVLFSCCLRYRYSEMVYPAQRSKALPNRTLLIRSITLYIRYLHT
jgi:hypothetical protein